MAEETRLKSPSMTELAPLIQKIDQMIDDGADVELTEPEAVVCVDALRWVLTFLDNRKLYHKRRQMQGKIERKLLEDALRGKGVDVSVIKQRAAQLEADELIEASEDLPEDPRGQS